MIAKINTLLIKFSNILKKAAVKCSCSKGKKRFSRRTNKIKITVKIDNLYWRNLYVA